MKSLALVLVLAAAVPAHQLEHETQATAGRLEGPYKAWHAGGQLLAEGRYKGGAKHGPWKLWYASGKPFATVAYADGVPSGSWTRWYADGTTWETCEFKDGKRIGVWLRYFPDGARHWQRSYDANGRREGFQAEWHPTEKAKDPPGPVPAWAKGMLADTIRDFEREASGKSYSSW